MSCSSNPVNIKTTKQICREDCSYSFDYNANSSAIISNMGDYLDIKVDGKNTVKFNAIDVLDLAWPAFLCRNQLIPAQECI